MWNGSLEVKWKEPDADVADDDDDGEEEENLWKIIII